MERAAILGLGAVGRTMVALGGDVAVGIDVNPDRIDLCRSTAGSATDDINAVRGCKLVFICVGTPVLPDGRQDGTQVKRALEDLKAVIDADTVVVIRSTITPEFLPKEYPNSVVVNPEFLRADSAMPSTHPSSSSGRIQRLSRCGSSTGTASVECRPRPRNSCAPPLRRSCSSSRATGSTPSRSTSRTWSGSLQRKWERVMSMFVKDRILNISERYLRPGPQFDGACLPKDLDVGVSTFCDFADVRLLDAVAAANRVRAGTDAFDG